MEMYHHYKMESPDFFLFRDSSDAILRFILFAMVRDKSFRENIKRAQNDKDRRQIKCSHLE